MTADIFGAVMGALVAIVGGSAYYAGWVRPLISAAKRREQEAQALEARAKAEAEFHANSILLEAKEEAFKLRERAEEEARIRLAVVSRAEEKLEARDESIEDRRNQLTEREGALLRERRSLAEREDDLVRKERKIEEELLKISRLTLEQAREIYLSRVEKEFEEVGRRKAKEVEALAIQDAERKARKVVLDVMQRQVVDYVTEATLAVVELPSEDMKGRIIGREGRNIRAFEQVTGVDLIIDETPEAVVISCFEPIRREVARLTLMNLMLDGRIHPGRIEELHEKAQAEVQRMVVEAGERAVERSGMSPLPPRVVDTLGRLRFRTSYAQNVLDHSVEVSRLCVSLAHEMGLNVEVARRAGLLHDIGKALGPEYEGPHALTGMQFLSGFGEKEAVLHAVGAHHFEIEPTTAEAILVIIADGISAARPGARRESLENYLKRLTNLEALANSFAGVERSYAVQAGREIRLIVKPTEVDDLAAARLANEVAKRIETEMEYPGQIRVTVIRETRVTQVAR